MGQGAAWIQWVRGGPGERQGAGPGWLCLLGVCCLINALRCVAVTSWVLAIVYACNAMKLIFSNLISNSEGSRARR